ncbi:hypothetical protein [Aquitalea sp. ASV11]|uniref:hypothetical protein n=1 Tax=Aquitalea sp. ASV11 TaxID=2795103 RepID=UPI0018EAA69A|nr:hypothetical protein [Aquitalea sp. ASV11]
MFDSIILRKSFNGDIISIGEVAEAMFYYQKVQLIIDQGTLTNFIKKLGPKDTLRLLNRPEISAVYCEEILGVQTQTYGVTPYHSFIAAKISGNQETGELKSLSERIAYTLRNVCSDQNEANKFAESFIKKTPCRDYSSDHYIKGGITKSALNDLNDQKLLRHLFEERLKQIDNEFHLSSDSKIEIYKENNNIRFTIFTDFNLNEFNRKNIENHNLDSPITMANILTSLLDANADLAIASHYGGDLMTTHINSEILKRKFDRFLHRTEINKEKIDNFRECILNNSPTITEVINTNERNIDELFKMLDKAEKFKHWSRNINPEENIVHEYIEEIQKKGVESKMKTKTIRYIIGKAISSIETTLKVAPAMSLSYEALDLLLLDKLLENWKPNHFITKTLTPFLSSNNK